MYKAVHRQESRTSTYGIGSLNLRFANQTTGSANGAAAKQENGIKISRGIARSISRRAASVLTMTRFTSVSNGLIHSNSRAVMHRAMAYSFGYLLTWIWMIIYMIMDVVGVLALVPPYPTWQIGFRYLTVVSRLVMYSTRSMYRSSVPYKVCSTL